MNKEKLKIIALTASLVFTIYFLIVYPIKQSFLNGRYQAVVVKHDTRGEWVFVYDSRTGEQKK